jgi:hypothetical protein
LGPLLARRPILTRTLRHNYIAGFTVAGICKALENP